MRIDQLRVQQGLAASRSQAQRLIAAGVSWRLPVPAGNPWRAVRKSGDDVPAFAELMLADDSESRYVSRGGLKLAGALAEAGLSVQGKLCLDVGQSTGGFTDCLLQAGAAHVVGVEGSAALVRRAGENAAANGLAQRSDIDRIAPGEFQRNKAGTRVFFTESQSGQNQSGQVFIYGEKDGKNTVTTAQAGRIVRAPNGSAHLELSQGQSVSFDTQTGEHNISTFSQYNTRIQDAPISALQTQTRSQPSHMLMQTAEGRGELSWRIGMALAAINLLLLALLLIKNTQRSGKGSHLALALMSFAVYYNLINFGQNWVAKGQIALGWWLLILHGGLFLACYGLLLQRQGSLPFFQSRRAATAGLSS